MLHFRGPPLFLRIVRVVGLLFPLTSFPASACALHLNCADTWQHQACTIALLAVLPLCALPVAVIDPLSLAAYVLTQAPAEPAIVVDVVAYAGPRPG